MLSSAFCYIPEDSHREEMQNIFSVVCAKLGDIGTNANEREKLSYF